MGRCDSSAVKTLGSLAGKAAAQVEDPNIWLFLFYILITETEFFVLFQFDFNFSF